MSTENLTEMFFSLEDIKNKKVNWKNVVIALPVTNKFTKGTTTITWTTSSVYYQHGQQKLPLYFENPEQLTFGISGKWGMNVAADDQNMDNIEGYQIVYPSTSLDTMNEPTADEAAIIDFYDKAWNLAAKAMIDFNDKDLIDGPAGSACTTAQKKKNMAFALKPIFEHPAPKNDKGMKVVDTSKPKRAYLPLATVGKGAKLKCGTKIYGPGDKLVPVTKYLSTPDDFKKGKVHPVVQWSQVYWGAHGTSTYGGSLKFKITEMNYTPMNDSGGSHRRMLSANTAADEDTVSASLSDDDNDEVKNLMKSAASFTHPVINSKTVNKNVEDLLEVTEEVELNDDDLNLIDEGYEEEKKPAKKTTTKKQNNKKKQKQT